MLKFFSQLSLVVLFWGLPYPVSANPPQHHACLSQLRSQIDQVIQQPQWRRSLGHFSANPPQSKNPLFL